MVVDFILMARHGQAGQGGARLGEARHGEAWLGGAWLGEARHGMVNTKRTKRRVKENGKQKNKL